METPARRPGNLDTAPDSAAREVAAPGFGEALRFWIKLGFISFGGPAGQIAIMQRELVEKRRWIGQERFLHALNFCMLLPGPEAQQLAIYCGWLLHRTRGGLAAGMLFVLPSAFILWGLSWLYVAHGQASWLAGALAGLQAAVVAVVAAAVPRLAAKALATPAQVVIAAAAFGLIFGLGVGFPWIVAGAALAGGAGRWLAPRWFPSGHGGRSAAAVAGRADAAAPGWGRALRVAAVGVGFWWAPVLVAGLALGWGSTLVAQGLFFSRAALVTFGGAYAVLPYVAERAVEVQGWLSGPQMLAGLAFAETTPGPLIMVLQFVGFMGGWNHPDGALSPLVSATLCAGMTTWVTFAPCFLWIFLGAPHVERLRGYAGLNAALAAVTAAVVGVVLNLAVWFAWQVWRPTDEAGPGWDGFAIVVSVAAFVALHRFKANLIAVIAASGAAGWLWTTAAG